MRVILAIITALFVANASATSFTHVVKQDGNKHVIGRNPAVPPRIKPFRANPHRLSAIVFLGMDPVDEPDDDYLMTFGRRRKMEYERNDHEADELSDYVKVRLLVARVKAMKVYQEKWA